MEQREQSEQKGDKNSKREKIMTSLWLENHPSGFNVKYFPLLPCYISYVFQTRKKSLKKLWHMAES